MKRIAWIAIAVGLIAGVAIPAAAQIDSSVYEQALASLSLSDRDRVMSALELGLSRPGFPATDVLALIERLVPAAGTPDEKEDVLFLLVRYIEEGLTVTGLLPVENDLIGAMEEGLPIDGIILEALKGIAQRRPAAVIEQAIEQRLSLLRDVRDLFFEKGIFSTPPGQVPATPNALPEDRFNALLTNTADAISDFLEGGGSPFDSDLLYEQLADRLSRLSQGTTPTIPASDADLVLGKLSPDDLTRVALAAVS